MVEVDEVDVFEVDVLVVAVVVLELLLEVAVVVLVVVVVVVESTVVVEVVVVVVVVVLVVFVVEGLVETVEMVDIDTALGLWLDVGCDVGTLEVVGDEAAAVLDVVTVEVEAGWVEAAIDGDVLELGSSLVGEEATATAAVVVVEAAGMVSLVLAELAELPCVLGPSADEDALWVVLVLVTMLSTEVGLDGDSLVCCWPLGLEDSNMLEEREDSGG
jgi:hypothetical protein